MRNCTHYGEIFRGRRKNYASMLRTMATAEPISAVAKNVQSVVASE